MSVCLVTGCAGFIGSHLTEELLSGKNTVIGIDSLNDYYDISIKQRNLDAFKDNKNFAFYKKDILEEETIKRIMKTKFHIGQIS